MEKDIEDIIKNEKELKEENINSQESESIEEVEVIPEMVTEVQEKVQDVEESNDVDEKKEKQNETNDKYKTYEFSEPKKELSNKKPKNNMMIKNVIIAILTILVIMLGAVLLSTDFTNSKNKEDINKDKVEEVYNNTESNITYIPKDEVVERIHQIVEECMPSIVSITTLSNQQFISWFGITEQEVTSGGSGIIVAEKDSELLIVTNYHVVENAKNITVFFSNKDGGSETEYPVSGIVKGYNSQKDLAMLSINIDDIDENVKNNLKIAKLGNSEELKLGESVIAIGNALGYGQSVTSGIVSAKNREIEVAGNNNIFKNKLIQTDAAINPGNSGGALLNMNGEVIGINSAKFASKEVEGMGYAIPISDIEEIIGELVSKETRDKVDENKKGYLGISCLDVTSDVSKMYNMPIGVFVQSTEPGLAAEVAGIKSGDIIVKLGGNTITSLKELKNELEYYEIGEEVEVVVKRIEENGYVEKEIIVKLSKQIEKSK